MTNPNYPEGVKESDIDSIGEPNPLTYEGDETLTKEEEFIYFWQHRMLGSFMTAIAECISRADRYNLEKLAKGFPMEVEAYKKFTHEDGWWESVEEKMRRIK